MDIWPLRGTFLFSCHDDLGVLPVAFSRLGSRMLTLPWSVRLFHHSEGDRSRSDGIMPTSYWEDKLSVLENEEGGVESG